MSEEDDDEHQVLQHDGNRVAINVEGADNEEDDGDLGHSGLRGQASSSHLPASLDDRRVPVIRHSSSVYDPWGENEVELVSVPSETKWKPHAGDFNGYDTSYPSLASSTQSLNEEDEYEAVIENNALNEEEKAELMQKIFTSAASNDNQGRVDRLLSGRARTYVDVNQPDEEGTTPLIYACCFGHIVMAAKLLDVGANPNGQDKHAWSALMWAMNNNHTGIVKLLLERGASTSVKSSTGRTAMDFITPNTELSDFMNETGYIGSAGAGTDFYQSGLAEDRFEDQLAENELKQRMMMESSMNLEVDLASLGLGATAANLEETELDETPDFVWDKCLPDQMFVFSEDDMDRILDISISKMQPLRSPLQKPVPANVLFLCARYAHHSGNHDLLSMFFEESERLINAVVMAHHDDMPLLAFWISNVTLLLYYVKKDITLVAASSNFQLHLSELLNDIYLNFVGDAIRRMDKVLNEAILDHETIPGLNTVTFQSEWRLFRRKRDQELQDPILPPSPRQRAKISPRNINSLLSSTLFVLDLYDIHPVIISQILAQLFYWLGAELFNRTMQHKKYLARTRAMQIRLNVSTLEDWAKNNNRSGGRYEQGSLVPSGESTLEAARKHLAPIIQLLQWLQCFSSLGDDFESFIATLQQLPHLTAKQLMYAAGKYRMEVGEKGLKPDMKAYLSELDASPPVSQSRSPTSESGPEKDFKTDPDQATQTPKVASGDTNSSMEAEHSRVVDDKGIHLGVHAERGIGHDYNAGEYSNSLWLDSRLMLPFVLPTTTETVVTYGAGLGGVNRDREKKYQPTLPSEFVTRLDATSEPSRPGLAHIWQPRGDGKEDKR